MTTDFLTGAVKCPGELPHEYLFITKDDEKTRIGEFVYYRAKVGEKGYLERNLLLATQNSFV